MTQNVEFTKLKRRLKKASTIGEKIEILEELVLVDPTYPFLSMQKSKFKKQLESLKLGNQKKPRPINTQNIYEFKRGRYQCCLLGMANSGKSTLLARLTNATPAISEVPFTTYRPEVGSLDYHGVEIQLVEVPAIFEGDSDRDENKYRFIKQTDLKIAVVNQPEELDNLLLELWNRNIMLGEERGPKGLVVYRQECPDTMLPKINVDSDVAEAIYKELKLSRVYVERPKLQRPISFMEEEVSVSRIREIIARKDRSLGSVSLLDETKRWKLIGPEYILKDGDHIKFQI